VNCKSEPASASSKCECSMTSGRDWAMRVLDASGNWVLLSVTDGLFCAGGDFGFFSTGDELRDCGSPAGGVESFECCSKEVYLI
jgi:hypothetical protein